jgi:hypothetical protein
MCFAAGGIIHAAKNDNPMHVVWHDHVGVERQFISDLGGATPFLVHNPSKCIGYHLVVNDPAKERQPVMRAYRQKIRSGRGIVPIPQAHRTPAPPARLAITLIALGSHRSFKIQN